MDISELSLLKVSCRIYYQGDSSVDRGQVLKVKGQSVSQLFCFPLFWPCSLQLQLPVH